MSKRTASFGLGSLATGAVTALAISVQTGLAAVVGVIIARELGRTAETDGFFAAYSVFIVLALAANAVRVTMLPSFSRARDEGRLAGEAAASGAAVAAVLGPAVLAGTVAARPIADVLTGDGGEVALSTAAATLPWMVMAGALQVYAGLAASALAAVDDYTSSALGFILGSLAGLSLILLCIDERGVQAVAWGMSLNGAVTVAVSGIVLLARALRERMPRTAVRSGGLDLKRRALLLATGMAVPLALQVIYVICLPLASRQGEGAVTSFGYAYLISSAVVAVTASSLGLVTAVPLTRIGLDVGRASRHVVASSWIGLLAIGLVAGVFSLAGEQFVEAVLGPLFSSEAGSELGRLVVVLSLWSAASVGVSVTFPLVFVQNRGRRLPRSSFAVVGLHVPLAILGSALFGLDGLALALGVTMSAFLALLLGTIEVLGLVALRLASGYATVVALAAVAFVPARVLVDQARAPLVGALLYLILIAVVRPSPLRDAWRYLRALA